MRGNFARQLVGVVQGNGRLDAEKKLILSDP